MGRFNVQKIATFSRGLREFHANKMWDAAHCKGGHRLIAS